MNIKMFRPTSQRMTDNGQTNTQIPVPLSKRDTHLAINIYLKNI